MNEMSPPKAERAAALKGLGSARKRVEDARFTQGKGNYVDDLKLPGMLFGDFVRSPYAHARVKSINTEAAMALRAQVHHPLPPWIGLGSGTGEGIDSILLAQGTLGHSSDCSQAPTAVVPNRVSVLVGELDELGGREVLDGFGAPLPLNHLIPCSLVLQKLLLLVRVQLAAP